MKQFGWSEPSISQLLVIICTKHSTVISVGGGRGSQSSSRVVSVCKTEGPWVLCKHLADLNVQLSGCPACHCYPWGGGMRQTKGPLYFLLTVPGKFVIPGRRWVLIIVTLDPNPWVPAPRLVVHTWKPEEMKAVHLLSRDQERNTALQRDTQRRHHWEEGRNKRQHFIKRRWCGKAPIKEE